MIPYLYPTNSNLKNHAVIDLDQYFIEHDNYNRQDFKEFLNDHLSFSLISDKPLYNFEHAPTGNINVNFANPITEAQIKLVAADIDGSSWANCLRHGSD